MATELRLSWRHLSICEPRLSRPPCLHLVGPGPLAIISPKVHLPAIYLLNRKLEGELSITVNLPWFKTIVVRLRTTHGADHDI
jgi:hypothetical protein